MLAFPALNAMPNVYLDTCCLNRPFDDQGQDRIRFESEAVVEILRRIQDDENWFWIGSDALQYETSKIPDAERKRRVQILLQFTTRIERSGPQTALRATDLRTMGFRAIDALHIACAEQGTCDIMFSTDDRMVKVARRNSKQLLVRVENPAEWLKSE